MNDLYEYFSQNSRLLIAYIIVIAAFAVTLFLAGVIKTAFKKAKKRRNEIVNGAIDEVLRESFDFRIIEDEKGYRAALFEEDKMLAVSPYYSSVAGVKSALKGLKNNAVSDNFTVFAGADGRFTVRLYSSVKLFYESEEYDSREQAEKELEKIKKAAATAEEI